MYLVAVGTPQHTHTHTQRMWDVLGTLHVESLVGALVVDHTNEAHERL